MARPGGSEAAAAPATGHGSGTGPVANGATALSSNALSSSDHPPPSSNGSSRSRETSRSTPAHAIPTATRGEALRLPPMDQQQGTPVPVGATTGSGGGRGHGRTASARLGGGGWEVYGSQEHPVALEAGGAAVFNTTWHDVGSNGQEGETGSEERWFDTAGGQAAAACHGVAAGRAYSCGIHNEPGSGILGQRDADRPQHQVVAAVASGVSLSLVGAGAGGGVLKRRRGTTSAGSGAGADAVGVVGDRAGVAAAAAAAGGEMAEWGSCSGGAGNRQHTNQEHGPGGTPTIGAQPQQVGAGPVRNRGCSESGSGSARNSRAGSVFGSFLSWQLLHCLATAVAAAAVSLSLRPVWPVTRAAGRRRRQLR